jgi:hypothetical protein
MMLYTAAAITVPKGLRFITNEVAESQRIFGAEALPVSAHTYNRSEGRRGSFQCGVSRTVIDIWSLIENASVDGIETRGLLRQAAVTPTAAMRFSTVDRYRYGCTSRLKIALFGHRASAIMIFVCVASAMLIVRSGTRTSKKLPPA